MSDKHDQVAERIAGISPLFRTADSGWNPKPERIAELLRREYGTAEPLRIFQCEQCGAIFDPATPEAQQGWHIVVNTVSGGDGYPTPEPGQCGPVKERFIADEVHSYNRAIDECALLFDHAAKRFEEDNEQILAERAPVAGQMLSMLIGMADTIRHLKRKEQENA